MNNGPSARSMAPSIVMERRSSTPASARVASKGCAREDYKTFHRNRRPFSGSIVRSKMRYRRAIPASKPPGSTSDSARRAWRGARITQGSAARMRGQRSSLPRSIGNIASRRRRMSRPTPDRARSKHDGVAAEAGGMDFKPGVAMHMITARPPGGRPGRRPRGLCNPIQRSCRGSRTRYQRT